MRNLLEISKSGLRAAERSLSVTANNIINADTPGYTRQRIEKSPEGMQMAGYNTGLGVNVDGITRLRNE
ncbi:MAG TPA: flagellar hook-associated protein FlgK, partial [Balneolaceae bacterium]|nr:flagellar hook-associated protein FlgK [Balneolaceae bacterium]